MRKHWGMRIVSALLVAVMLCTEVHIMALAQENDLPGETLTTVEEVDNTTEEQEEVSPVSEEAEDLVDQETEDENISENSEDAAEIAEEIAEEIEDESEEIVVEENELQNSEDIIEPEESVTEEELLGTSTGDSIRAAAQNEWNKWKGNTQTVDGIYKKIILSQNNYAANGCPYGNDNWCAYFVSRCLNNAGVINKTYAGADICRSLINEGLATYVSSPMPGDIVEYTSGAIYQHVAIVDGTVNGNVMTFQGNLYYSGKLGSYWAYCDAREYNMGKSKIRYARITGLNSVSKPTPVTYEEPRLEQKDPNQIRAFINNEIDSPDGNWFVRGFSFYNPYEKVIEDLGLVIFDKNGNQIAKGSEIGVQDSYVGTTSKHGWIYEYTNREIHPSNVIEPQHEYKYGGFIRFKGEKEINSWKDKTGNERLNLLWTVKTGGPVTPASPQLSVSKTTVAVGKTVDVTWSAVNGATNGYEITINGPSYAKTVKLGTGTTKTTFSLPNEGTYTVTGISKGAKNSAVSSPKTVKAVGPRTVVFVMTNNNDEEVEVARRKVTYGESVSIEAPTKEGHSFQGWDSGLTNITEDKTVHAVFKKNKYSVTFYNADGMEVLGKQTVEYKDNATPPEDPDAPDGYIFAGWSSNEYECVTKNTSVYASYVWENQELPVLLQNVKCEFDDDGYMVTYDIKNYDIARTSGRAIVALKTENGRLLATTESSAFSLAKNQQKTGMEVFVPYAGLATQAEVVIVNSFKNEIPISASSVVNATRDWTEWSPEEPAGETDVESRTEYRFREKEFKQSSASTMEGWTQYKSSYVVNDDGTWSKWQKAPVTATETRLVETKNVSDNNSYQQEVYYFYKRPGALDFYPYDKGGYEYKEYTWRSNDGGPRPKQWRVEEGQMSYAMDPPNFTWGVYYGWELWWLKSSQTIPATTHKEYRYKDRSKTYTYYYYKWKDWSDYSGEPVSATADREVETRTAYRYKAAITGDGDTSGTERTIEGYVAPEFEGRQAMLLVYKGDEPADYNNEYVSQTVIGEGGHYSFTYVTREDPSVKTGDFTIDLSIEGATAPIYLDTLVAPKPSYRVRFIDYDGSVISEQSVVKGENAVLPENPEREHYIFTGWDTGTSNIHDDMDITALYQKDYYIVTFVDWTQKTAESVPYDYDEELQLPQVADPEGYTLSGWYDESGNKITSGTRITRSMTLNADYDILQYTVNIFDEDKNLISTQQVDYGSAADMGEAPEKEGMVFRGWSTTAYSNVKSDLDIYPVFEYEQTAAIPTADLESGSINSVKTLHLQSADNATIYYTTDNSSPSVHSTVYTDAGITIDRNMIVRYIAAKPGMNTSQEGLSTYLLVDAEDEEGALVIKKNKYTVEKGNQFEIGYFLSEGYAAEDVQLYSLNENILRVNEDNTLTAARVGETQILAMTPDQRYGDFCDVEIFSSLTPVTSLEVDSWIYYMEPGDEKEIEVTVSPANASDKEVTWFTEDPEVVSVDEDGKLYATGYGFTALKVYANGGNCMLTCYANVQDPSLEVDSSAISIKVAGAYQLQGTKHGNIPSEPVWYSENTAIATVDATGKVSGIYPGTTKIHYATEDGVYDASAIVVVTSRETTDKEALLDSDVNVVKAVHFTGGEVTPGVQVIHNGVTLTEDVDYQLVYSNNIKVGTGKVTVVGSGDFTGKITKTFEIVPADEPITEGMYVDPIADQTYTGSALTPAVFVYDGESMLVEGVDYKLSYKNNTKVTTDKSLATVTITGLGQYTSSSEITFKIVRKSIEEDDVIVTYTDVIAGGKATSPLPKITYNGKSLKNNTDFKVTYQYEGAAKEVTTVSAVGNAEMIIRGAGNFEGEIRKDIVITNKPLLSTCKLKPEKSSYDYTGAEIIPGFSLTGKLNGKKGEIPAGQYTVSCTDNIECGTATLTLTAKEASDFAGSVSATFKIKGWNLSKAQVAGIVNKDFTGNAATQDPDDLHLTYKVSRNEIIDLNPYDENTGEGDYTVSYLNNTNAGTATIVFTGKNRCEGTAKKTFKIQPVALVTNRENNANIVIDCGATATYQASGAVPDVTITYKRAGLPDYELVENVDYKLTFGNNKKANAIATVTVDGKGNFAGKMSNVATFTVSGKPVDSPSVVISVSDPEFKNGTKNYNPKPVVMDGKSKLKEGKDYKVISYTSTNVEQAGETLYTVTIEGLVNYSGTNEATYRVVAKSISKASVKVIPKIYYTGSAIEPSKADLQISIKDGRNTIVLGEDDYDIVTYADNVKTGQASILLRGKGNYGGEVTVKFLILPRWLKGLSLR